MKIQELLKESVDISYWEELSKDTQKELVELFGESVSFHGGYCFHLALAMFLKAKKKGIDAIMIADGGHVAVYDTENDVSVDENGVHNFEDALSGRRQRTWRTAKGLIKVMQGSWADKEQLDRLDQTFEKYK
jgi:5-formaminoimidazole-4-carboxamide-1-beta-D-ribofuranosyl 5'-monophosphate synthetase